MKAYAVNIEEIFPPAKIFKTPAELINKILPLILILAGIIVFLLLIGGGFMMIQGASSGESEQVGKGKKAATYAVVGFIIIFASYWIAKLISKITGVPII